MIRKKLFSHGESKAVDLPANLVKKDDTVYIEEGENCLVIFPENNLASIDDDPLFTPFVQTLLLDAMKNPAKLKEVEEVWDKEWDALLHCVSDVEE